MKVIMLGNFVKSAAGIYVGGLYYFSIVTIPFMIMNRKHLKVQNPWAKVIAQIALWVVTMPQIMRHGNPLLELENCEKN